MLTQEPLDVLNRIKGQIYIGNSSAAKNFGLLKNHNISHILICCSEIGPAFVDKFSYKKLNIQETFDFSISDFFDEAFEFIETGLLHGTGVLVHCIQGQSRSPTIVASYLMRKFGLKSKKALSLIKKKHPPSQPNVGFIEQLVSLERNLKEPQTSLTCSACKCLIQ